MRIAVLRDDGLSLMEEDPLFRGVSNLPLRLLLLGEFELALNVPQHCLVLLGKGDRLVLLDDGVADGLDHAMRGELLVLVGQSRSHEGLLGDC
jgi:hypothetical protein